MFFTTSSSKKFTEIKDALPKACEQKGFKVLVTFDYKKILKEKGFPIEREAMVFEVCMAPVASHILSRYPELIPYLPCKIGIYEDSDKTIITMFEMQSIIDSDSFDNITKSKIFTLYNTLKVIIQEITK